MIELMVTIAVTAILLAIAVPSFNQVTLGNRLGSIGNDFVASVRLARSEAIKRNAQVTLCASSNGTSCGGSWNQGWIILRGAAVLQRRMALPSNISVTETDDIVSLGFPSSGVGITLATLKVCQTAPLGSQERVVSVSNTGVASVTKTTTGTCP